LCGDDSGLPTNGVGLMMSGQDVQSKLQALLIARAAEEDMEVRIPSLKLTRDQATKLAKLWREVAQHPYENHGEVVVPIGNINFDLWPRIATSKVHLERLEDRIRWFARRWRAGSEFPPILLARHNRTTYLIDGALRVLAASQAGLTEVSAEVLTGEHTLEQLSWRAWQAHIDATPRLTTAEIREGLRRLVAAGQYWYMLEEGVRAVDFPHWRGKQVLGAGILTGLYMGGLVEGKTLRKWLKEDHPQLYRDHYRAHYRAVKGGRKAANSLTKQVPLKEPPRNYKTVRPAAAGVVFEMARREMQQLLKKRPVELNAGLKAKGRPFREAVDLIRDIDYTLERLEETGEIRDLSPSD
jgi:hypothetical protein